MAPGQVGDAPVAGRGERAGAHGTRPRPSSRLDRARATSAPGSPAVAATRSVAGCGEPARPARRPSGVAHHARPGASRIVRSPYPRTSGRSVLDEVERAVERRSRYRARAESGMESQGPRTAIPLAKSRIDAKVDFDVRRPKVVAIVALIATVRRWSPSPVRRVRGSPARSNPPRRLPIGAGRAACPRDGDDDHSRPIQPPVPTGTWIKTRRCSSQTTAQSRHRLGRAAQRRTPRPDRRQNRGARYQHLVVRPGLSTATAPPADSSLTKTLVGVAHRTLPCGTMITFRNPETASRGHGPGRRPRAVRRGRQWDLTHGAVRQLGHCYTGSSTGGTRRAPTGTLRASTRTHHEGSRMRILVVGAGGVGSAVAPIAARRDFFEHIVVADYDPAGRAHGRAARRRTPVQRRPVDASDRPTPSPRSCRANGITHVLQRGRPAVRHADLRRRRSTAGADYLDMAMSLSQPHPERPYEQYRRQARRRAVRPGRGLGRAGRLALVGIGVEPGLSDVFARYAADHLFSAIDEVGVRDGANLMVEGYDFAPSFSIWTTIEECLNPPVDLGERTAAGTRPRRSREPEVFDFPEGIGPVECVNVEHEEVLLVPRWVDAKRVTFKYGLGDEFIDVLKIAAQAGPRPDRQGARRRRPRSRRGTWSPPRCPTRPRSATRCSGKTCAGTWVTGTGKDGQPARGLPLPRGRQRVVDARIRLAGRRLADGHQPGRRAGAARQRRLVGQPASSARRRSTPSRSSTC